MIIARYLSTKILFSTLAVAVVLTMVVMSSRLARYISAAAEGTLAVSLVLPVVFFRMPQLLELILPVSLLLGIMLSVGELYETNEMTAISTSGVSHGRVMLIGLGASVFVALVVALFSFYISPKGNDFVANLVSAQGLKSELNNLAPDTFYDLKNQGGTFYAGSVDNERTGMEDVFVFRSTPLLSEDLVSGTAQPDQTEDQDQDRQTIIYSSRGYQEYREDGGFYFVLEDGVQFEGSPGQKNYVVTEFERYSQRIDVPEDMKNSVVKSEYESMSLSQLIGLDGDEPRAELHWRLSLPISVIVLAAIGLPLSRSNPRQGRYYLLLPALVLFLVYMVMLNAGKEAIASGEGSPFMQIWLVHICLFAIAAVFHSWPTIRLSVYRRRLARLGQ